MENLDRLVQLITDRLLEKMSDEPLHSPQGLVYVIGETTETTLLLEQGFELTKDISISDIVLVNALSVDSFLRIANLCPTTSDESNLLTALLSGQKVLVSLEALGLDRYKKTANALLYRNLLKQKETLEKYGVQFYHDDQLVSLLSNAKKNGQQHKEYIVTSRDTKAVSQEYPKKHEPSSSSGKRLLITESRLKERNLSEGDTFKIEKGMIITALAKDYLKRHHITIIE